MVFVTFIILLKNTSLKFTKILKVYIIMIDVYRSHIIKIYFIVIC